jgi:hypothetical protein
MEFKKLQINSMFNGSQVRGLFQLLVKIRNYNTYKMKKFYLLALSLNLLLASCSSEDDGVDPPEPVANTAPSVPVLLYPTNNLICIENNIDFQWEASTDAEENVVKYEVQVATDNSFSEGLQTDTTLDVHKQISLERGKMYYWRMKATDTKDASSEYSEVFNFYTEGDGVVNHVPFAPEIVSPELNSAQASGSIELNWTAADADENDDLEYDVYFGQSPSPSNIIAEGITSNSLILEDVATPGDYYWQIVVRDNQGGTTVGQVWNFKVE